MKTSEFDSVELAIARAKQVSVQENRIVSLWCDNCTLDDALDCVDGDDGEHEVIDAGCATACIDAWSKGENPDWRIVVRTAA